MSTSLLTRSIARAVPYHNNVTDTYFFGNSIAAASGKPDGEWTFLIGPDYTSPNYIASEKLSLVCAGREYPLDLQMKRLRTSGVFFGCTEVQGFRVAVWDFAPFGTCDVLRFIRLENRTGTACAPLVRARITPFEANTVRIPGGICITKDTDAYCFGNRETRNWAERCCRIRWDGLGRVESDGEGFVLTTTPDENGVCTLIHHCSYGESDVTVPDDTSYLLETTLRDWEAWVNAGHMPPIANQRDADTIESLLLCVKMQQNRDGGAIAGIRKYANSYIRDTHGCMRMLLATGHHEEVSRLLRNIHTRWAIAGYIPNWWSMGSDTFIGGSFNNNASEITAYYLFMARDYLAATGNRALIDEILPSLRWAVNAQLDWLREHDYTMDFNGDETEQYCCNEDGQEYGGFPNPLYNWNHKKRSFSSTAAALCSLEWFAGLTGEDLSADIAAVRAKIDAVFYDPARGVHIWNADAAGDGWVRSDVRLTNYQLIPLWVGAKLTDHGEVRDALSVRDFVRGDGLLPNSPDVATGFCGHTMGLYLYDMVKAGDEGAAACAARAILDTPLLSMYGTVSEFYGPGCVPNGHNCRGFEGGIVGEALVKYFESSSR